MQHDNRTCCYKSVQTRLAILYPLIIVCMHLYDLINICNSFHKVLLNNCLDDNVFYMYSQEFISTLTDDQKDKVLLEVLSNGKGSLDYAKNIVEFGGIPPEIPDTRPPWCKCGVCQLMPTNEENKCCGKIRCLTSYATFRNICIDREVLIMAIRSRCDIRVEEPDYSTNSFRKAAYRQFIIWGYKKLGKGNRKVCPSCVVLSIRLIYPANDGVYMGFKRA